MIENVRTTKARINFFNDAPIIHSNKYDYSTSNYIKSSIKIDILCYIHGLFSMTPNNHLRGQGCPKCGREKMKNSPGFKKSIENININKTEKARKTFKDKAEFIHQSKYNYDQFIYIDSKTKSNILCNIHGLFMQSPNSHLAGHGCPKCANEKLNILKANNNIKNATKKFFAKVKLSYKNLNFDNYKYSGVRSPSVVICDEHGEFLRTPGQLYRGNGCIKCRKTKRSVDINSKHILYYVKSNNFYKIGITAKTVEERFSYEIKNTDFKILKMFHYDDGNKARITEKLLLSLSKPEYKINKEDSPFKNGWTECFNCDILGYDNL